MCAKERRMSLMPTLPGGSGCWVPPLLGLWLPLALPLPSLPCPSPQQRSAPSPAAQHRPHGPVLAAPCPPVPGTPGRAEPRAGTEVRSLLHPLQAP